MRISEETLAKLKEYRSDYQKRQEVSKLTGHPYRYWMGQAAIELKALEPIIPDGRPGAWNKVVDHLVRNHGWAE